MASIPTVPPRGISPRKNDPDPRALRLMNSSPLFSSLRLWPVLFSIAIGFLGHTGAADSPKHIAEDFSKPELGEAWDAQQENTQIENGWFIIKPETGQRFLATAAAVKFGTIDVEFQPETPSEADRVTYYLGFQSIKPWAEDIVWIKIQEGTIFATVKKGDKVEEKLLTYINPGVPSRLRIEWTAERVVMEVNGKVVFETGDADVIPTEPLYACFVANTQRPLEDGRVAELRIKSVEISTEQEGAIRRNSTSAKPAVENEKLAAASGVKLSVEAGALVLESEGARCKLDLTQGISLRQLKDLATGVSCIDMAEASPLFILNAPGASVGSLDITVTGVKLSDADGDGVATIAFHSDSTKLDGQLTLRMDAQGKMKWKLVASRGPSEIPKLQMVFPILSGIAIGGDAGENRFFFPQRTGIEGKASVDLTQEYGGGLAWMQVMGVHSPATGSRLTVFPMDSTGAFKGLRFRKPPVAGQKLRTWAETIYDAEVPRQDALKLKGKGIALAYYYLRRPFSDQGTTETPEVAVTVAPGGWKETLADYGTWARTWYSPPSPPPWFKSMANYWNVHPTRFWSAEEKRYIGTEVIGEKKVDVVQVFGWEDFNDSLDIDEAFKKYQPGDFKINVARGGLEPFRQEVKRHQDAGVRYTVYVNPRFVYRDSEFGKKFGDQLLAMHGPNAITTLADQQVLCYSFYDDRWWDHLVGSLARLVRETGMDGVYLDELGILYPDYNPTHKHWRELGLPQDTQTMARHMIQMRDAIRAANPQAIVWTEHAGSDWFSQYNDGSWIQTFYSGQYGWVEDDFDESSLYFFRFLFPEYVLTEWGDSRDGANRCFFNGVGRDTGCGPALDKILREQADAFASLRPEPLIPTLVPGVLANKFPVKGKTVVTLYNKSGENVGGEVVSLPCSGRKNWKITELVSGKTCEFRYDLAANRLVIFAEIPRGKVAALCVTEES